MRPLFSSSTFIVNHIHPNSPIYLFEHHASHNMAVLLLVFLVNDCQAFAEQPKFYKPKKLFTNKEATQEDYRSCNQSNTIYLF